MTFSSSYSPPLVCEVCGSILLLPNGAGDRTCPNCFRDALDPVTQGEQVVQGTPEGIVPFAIGPDEALRRLDTFTQAIPFRPKEIEEGALRQRLRQTYLPVWLVDADLETIWKAEVGYHYQVVSHKEDYISGAWRTREVKETRTRWEPRVGRMQTRIDNVPAPALDGFMQLMRQLDGFDLKRMQPFAPEHLNGAAIRLAARTTQDAWGDAEPRVQEAASGEVQRAATADEIRDFAWAQPQFQHNWTQVLVPVYTTYYLDDDDEKQVLFVNGVTGNVNGDRRDSMRRAQPRALIFGGIGLAAGAISIVLALVLLLVFPPAALVGLAGLAVAVGFGVAAISPVVRVMQFNNRTQNAQVWKTTLTKTSQ
ncbi:MAG: hypothetical protein ACFB51_07760 [Anaerolineae bacterium]